MSKRTYRILGGPKHGELIEMESHQKTLNCILPSEPVVASWTVQAADELFKTKMFIYEISTFSFPHVFGEIAVLTPKGAEEAEREAYLIAFIAGGNLHGSW